MINNKDRYMRITLIITAFLLAVSFSFAQDSKSKIDTEKKELVIKYLKISRILESTEEMLEYMIKNIKMGVGDVPEEFWSNFKENIDYDKYLESLVPIYDRHYNKQELKQLIEFYESPTGQKLLDTQPKIFEERRTKDERWTSRIREQLFDKLKEEGYIEGQ